MFSIIIRYYEELNFFLPKHLRKTDIPFHFKDKRSVKDLIKSMNVPHVEVDMILVNGESVDFNYIVQDGDRISVYPIFETFNVSGVSILRKTPLRKTKFVLDVHLRKLARRLRLLGFDVNYAEHRDDPELAEISRLENRILLTRDKQLLMRKIIDHGLYVRNTNPEKQLYEILNRLDLWDKINPFTRCMECNGHINKLVYDDYYNEITTKVPAGVLEWCQEFFLCQSCQRIYWKGSHYDKLIDIVNNLPRI